MASQVARFRANPTNHSVRVAQRSGDSRTRYSSNVVSLRISQVEPFCKHTVLRLPPYNFPVSPFAPDLDEGSGRQIAASRAHCFRRYLARAPGVKQAVNRPFGLIAAFADVDAGLRRRAGMMPALYICRPYHNAGVINEELPDSP